MLVLLFVLAILMLSFGVAKSKHNKSEDVEPELEPNKPTVRTDVVKLEPPAPETQKIKKLSKPSRIPCEFQEHTLALKNKDAAMFDLVDAKPCNIDGSCDNYYDENDWQDLIEKQGVNVGQWGRSNYRRVFKDGICGCIRMVEHTLSDGSVKRYSAVSLSDIEKTKVSGVAVRPGEWVERDGEWNCEIVCPSTISSCNKQGICSSTKKTPNFGKWKKTESGDDICDFSSISKTPNPPMVLKPNKCAPRSVEKDNQSCSRCSKVYLAWNDEACEQCILRKC